jgi:hypothetical protein
MSANSCHPVKNNPKMGGQWPPFPPENIFSGFFLWYVSTLPTRVRTIISTCRTRGVSLTGLSPFWEKVYLTYYENFYFYFIPT